MWRLLSLILGNPLDRALKSVDTYVQSETKREETRAAVVTSYLSAQVSVLNGANGKWMMLFMALFVIPFAFWWGAVCLYSVLWCARCAYPQAWVIAALPEPLATHGGYIIASLFVGYGGVQAVGKYTGRGK
jgi:hypothetical protein